MNTRNAWHVARLVILGLLLSVMIVLAPNATPAAFAAPLIPAATLLNADGTLNLRAGTSGAIDLRGWNVTLDAVRGPVFEPAETPPNVPTALVWSTLGTGMSGGGVTALAVSGTDLYVGGLFTTCGGTPNCNNIAKWNGSSWSMLGTGMDSNVFALAVSGTNLYAGGYFTTCGGTSGCNYVAKYGSGIGTCTSQATGNWNTIATWNCGTVPATGDSVVIANTHTVTLDVNTADLKDFTINGGTLTNDGNARTVSLTGNWSNSGTFTPGTFIGVTFDGTGTQTLTGNTTFYNLNVNSGSTLDVGSSVVAVNGTATNVGTIKRLAPAQAIALSADYTFNDGVGQPTAIINQSAGTAMGNTTVQVNAHATTAHACSATTLGGTPVKRYFDITPTNGANVTADITLYFFDGASNSEANGNLLANIAIYHCEGGTWVRLSGGTYSTGTSGNYKWVKLAGHSYTAFSPFAIGGGPGSPTAVTLSQFSAQPGFDLGAWFRKLLGR